MNVYLQGKRLSLKPHQLLGAGGEAEVYDIGGGCAVKLFKQPDHPDYASNQISSDAAASRIAEHQHKLRNFPTGLPERVIAPEELVYDQKQRSIVGYTMRLVSGSTPVHHFTQPASRLAGVGNALITNVFGDLRLTVSALHDRSVIIGDFNDLNVLACGPQAYVIDADSFQYGQYLCPVFTDSFVDPLICKKGQKIPILGQSFNPESDWYAYTTMLFSALLCVGPYGGVYKPQRGDKAIAPAARPLERITVFHPSVKYPKPALPYSTLPDDLLDYFHKVFERDTRGAFPEALLKQLNWRTCQSCGLEYAKPYCPMCHSAPALRSTTPITIRGGVSVREVFATAGVIVAVQGISGGRIRYLVYDNGTFRREDNSTVCSGRPVSGMHYVLLPNKTVFSMEGTLTTIAEGDIVSRQATDRVNGSPSACSSTDTLFYLNDGALLRSGNLGFESVGGVLQNRTRFWTGETFGFGFYQAGEMNIAFVFETQGRGINDTVTLPRIPGHFLGGSCAFSSKRCWFRYAYRLGGKTFVACAAINRNGTMEGHLEIDEHEESWLRYAGELAAVGDMLLASTDEGIIRIELIGGIPVKTRDFPDTEPFIKRSSQIFPSSEGLYVVDEKQIRLMNIA